jgi:hypothetical protein
MLSQYFFRFLDANCQQSLTSKLDFIQTNLVVSEKIHDNFISYFVSRVEY